MAGFPDNLPPENLDILYKYILYFSIIYILATAITARLITRKRVKSVKKEETRPIVEEIEKTSIEEDIFDFPNQQDRTAGLLVQIISTQTAIDELGQLKESDKISDDAFLLLNTKYNENLEQLSSLVESLPPMFDEEPEIIDDELTVEIESKDDSQFLDDLGLDDNDDDEFLKPKSDGIPRVSAPTNTPPTTASHKPAAPKSFAAPKPEVPKSFAAPKPEVPKSFTAPKPAAPKSFTAPKPATPKSFTPQKPSSAPQPMSPQQSKSGEGDEKIFAKSTSIAAIRMDMLRELARLKKLINEDE